MMHPRQTIRHALRDVLRGTDEARTTAAGRKVYASRTVPIMPSHFPAILVYTTRDSRDAQAPYTPGGVIRRFLTVAVEVAAAGEDADDQVDALSAEVEDVLARNDTLAGAVESLTWQQTEIDLAGDGDEPVVAARLEFQAVYYSLPAEEPEDPIPTQVMASWEPETGLAHEDDYEDATETELGVLGDGA